MTFYSERLDRMVEARVIEAWLNGRRRGTEARLQLSDPREEPFLRSLLRPKLEVSEEVEKLRIRTKAMHFAIAPMRDVDAGAASAYATVYKLETYRNAFESCNHM